MAESLVSEQKDLQSVATAAVAEKAKLAQLENVETKAVDQAKTALLAQVAQNAAQEKTMAAEVATEANQIKIDAAKVDMAEKKVQAEEHIVKLEEQGKQRLAAAEVVAAQVEAQAKASVDNLHNTEVAFRTAVEQQTATDKQHVQQYTSQVAQQAEEIKKAIADKVRAVESSLSLNAQRVITQAQQELAREHTISTKLASQINQETVALKQEVEQVRSQLLKARNTIAKLRAAEMSHYPSSVAAYYNAHAQAEMARQQAMQQIANAQIRTNQRLAAASLHRARRFHK
jgi:hypothetical protein